MQFVHKKPSVLIGYQLDKGGFKFFTGSIVKSFIEHIKR